MDSKQENTGSRPSRSRQPEGAAGLESKPEQQEAEGEASRGAASRMVAEAVGDQGRSPPLGHQNKTKLNQYFAKNSTSITLKFY